MQMYYCIASPYQRQCATPVNKKWVRRQTRLQVLKGFTSRYLDRQVRPPPHTHTRICTTSSTLLSVRKETVNSRHLSPDPTHIIIGSGFYIGSFESITIPGARLLHLVSRWLRASGTIRRMSILNVPPKAGDSGYSQTSVHHSSRCTLINSVNDVSIGEQVLAAPRNYCFVNGGLMGLVKEGWGLNHELGCFC